MKKILFILLFCTIYLFSYEGRLENFIYKKFIAYYPNIDIESVKIKTTSVIPKGYTLDRVYFPKSSIKRNSGSFSALFSKDENAKRVYFKFYIKATVPVLMAVEDIPSHTPLNSSMFTRVPINFINFYDKPVYKLIGRESKVYIPKGKILVSRLVRRIPAIHRGDIVQAVAKDEGIEINFDVKALSDGQIGKIIKVKREGAKVLKAKVLSRDRVLIK